MLLEMLDKMRGVGAWKTGTDEVFSTASAYREGGRVRRPSIGEVAPARGTATTTSTPPSSPLLRSLGL